MMESSRYLEQADCLMEDYRLNRQLNTRLAAEAIRSLVSRVEHLEKGHSVVQDEIQQTLGKVLGYPWFKDDQKNFPGATEENGVCVGDHVAESIALEAARKIRDLLSLAGELSDAMETGAIDPDCDCETCKTCNALIQKAREAIGRPEDLSAIPERGE